MNQGETMNKIKFTDYTCQWSLFLNIPEGTGKNCLVNILLAKIRMNKKISIAKVLSMIAATLFPGWKLAHSIFNIPIKTNRIENTISHILKKFTNVVRDKCTKAKIID